MDYIPYNPEFEKTGKESLIQSINEARARLDRQQVEQQQQANQQSQIQQTQERPITPQIPTIQELREKNPNLRNLTDEQIVAAEYKYVTEHGIKMSPEEFWREVGYKPKYLPTPYDEIRLTNPTLVDKSPEELAQKAWQLKQQGIKFTWDDLNQAKDYDEFLKTFKGPSKFLQEVGGGAVGLGNLLLTFVNWAPGVVKQLWDLSKVEGERIKKYKQCESVFPGAKEACKERVDKELQPKVQEAAKSAQEIQQKLQFKKGDELGYAGRLFQFGQHLIALPFEYMGKGIEEVVPYEKYPLGNSVANLVGGLVMVKAFHWGAKKILGKGMPKELESTEKTLDKVTDKTAETLKNVVENSKEPIFDKDNPLSKVEEDIKKNPDISTEEVKKKLDGIAKEIAEDEKFQEKVKENLEEKPQEEINAEQKPETGKVYEGVSEQRVQEEGGTAGETMPTYEGGERVGIERPEPEPIKVTEEGKPEEIKAEEIQPEEVRAEKVPQEKINFHLGAEDKIILPDNTEVPVRYGIVEADDLITSHDALGNLNPEYPQELQPRGRERAASVLQIDRMAKKLVPERLVQKTPEVSVGSPIIGEDRIVESGNGRVLAIKKAPPNRIKKYKEYLTKHAEEFGLDPDKVRQMKKPILVRVREGEVDRQKFVIEANKPPVAEMSMTERAKVDSNLIDDGLLSLLEADETGNLNAPHNRPFVVEFIKRLTAEERGQFLTKEGYLSKAGIERLKNAILFKAYNNERLLEKIAESPTDDIKTISNVLVKISPRIADINRRMEVGSLHQYDLTENINEALKIFELAKNAGMNIEEFIAQQGMFEGNWSPEAIQIAKVFEDFKRSGKKLTMFFNKVLDGIEAMGDPNQIDMFGDTHLTMMEILSNAKKYAEGNENVYTQSLLFHSGGPDTNLIFKRIEDAIDDTTLGKATKEGLKYEVKKLKNWLLPSMISLKDETFKFVYDKAIEKFIKEKSQGIDKWMNSLDNDGLMTDISQDRKLSEAFNKMLFILDEYNDKLKILDDKEGIPDTEIGPDAVKIMDAVAQDFNLSPTEADAVKTLYKRWFDASKEVHNEIVSNIKVYYEDKLSRLDDKIAQVQEKLKDESLSKEDRSYLENQLKKFESQRWETERNYQNEMENIGFIKYYAPHVWEPSNFILLVKDKKSGEVVHREALTSKKLTSRIKKQLMEQFPKEEYDYKITVNQDPNLIYGDFEREMSAVKNLVHDLINKAGIDESAREAIENEFQKWLKSRGFMQRFMKRKGVTGYIQDRGIEVITKYLAGYEGMKAKRAFLLDLKDMPKPHPYDRNRVWQYIYNLVRNENQIDRSAAKVKSFLFFKYLGFKPNAPLRNLTQPYIMTAPYLKMEADKLITNKKVGMGEVLSTIAHAQKQSFRIAIDVMKSRSSEQFAERISRYNFLSPEEKEALIEAYKQGNFRSTMMQEWSGQTGAGFRTAWRKLVELGGLAFHWSDVSNRVTSFLSDYRFFKDLEHAMETTRKTQFVYNKVDMPIAFGGEGAMSNLGRVAYTFESYPLNETRVWYELANNKSYWPLAFSVLSYAVIGGASAVPLVAFLKAMYNKVTGTDLDQKLKTEMNPVLYRITETGLPSLIGIDLSTQFGFSLPFLNSYAMTYNDNLPEYWLRNIGGALYNVIKQTDFAWKAFKKEDFRDFIIQNPLTPRVMTNLLNAYFAKKYGVKNMADFPIYIFDKELQKIRLNDFEVISKALGFQPLKLSEYYTHRANKELLKQHYKSIKQGLYLELERTVSHGQQISPEILKRIDNYDKNLLNLWQKGWISFDEYKDNYINPKTIKATILRRAKELKYINIPYQEGR